MGEDVKTLLPCPFCGSEAKLTGFKAPEFWVMCPRMGCKASTEAFGSQEKAVAAWNTRLAQPQSGDERAMRDAAESVLAWCSHVEKFGYERMNEGPDASPHFLAGEARAFVERALATPTPDAAQRAALEAAVTKVLPVGDDKAPGDKVIAFYIRMDELRAIRALAAGDVA